MAAKWSEFDLRDPDNATWTKPSHHTKQKRTPRVALHPEAVSLLLDMKARPSADAVYLFAGADGRPLGGIETAWRNLMVRSQIKDFRIHDLRHTFASLLNDEGASLAEIGALLGHTQAATTFRYAHLSLEAQKRSLARLASPPRPVALLEASHDTAAIALSGIVERRSRFFWMTLTETNEHRTVGGGVTLWTSLVPSRLYSHGNG